jgi:glycosyltransferase involved in cell wall biosynthesis
MAVTKRVLLLQTREIASVSSVNHLIAQALINAGHEVSYLYLEKGTGVVGARAVYNLHLRKQDYAGTRRVAKKALIEFFRVNQFEVIFANMYKPTELLASLHNYLNGARCYGSFCAFGDFDRWSRRFSFRLKNKSRFEFISISEQLSDYLIEKNVGITTSNCHCIPLAIDVKKTQEEAFSAQEARKFLGFSEQHQLIGTIGRLVKDKQQGALIRAFADISPRFPEARLVIIGEGEERARLTQLINDLNLKAVVTLLGAMSQARRYLNAFDVFVFPSRSEGFGLALIEAMAYSRPVIVNSIEPLMTILSDTGLNVDVRSRESLANAVEKLLTMDAIERKQLGERARCRVESYYDISQFNQTYCRLVESSAKTTR